MCIIEKCFIPWLPSFFLGKDAKGLFVVTYVTSFEAACPVPNLAGQQKCQRG